MGELTRAFFKPSRALAGAWPEFYSFTQRSHPCRNGVFHYATTLRADCTSQCDEARCDNRGKAPGRSLPPVKAKLLTALPTLPLFPHGMFGFEKRQTGDVSS